MSPHENLFQLEKDQIINYSPNYHLIHLFRELEKRLTIITISILIFVLLSVSFKILGPLMKSMCHIFLLPLKPFLIGYSGTSGFGLFMDGIGYLAYGGFFLAGFLIAGVLIYSNFKASHIALNRDGIHLFRSVMMADGVFYNPVRTILWDSVDRVSLLRKKNQISIKDYTLEFEYREGIQFRIRLGDIYVPEERNYFLNMLTSKLDCFDKKDLEILKPANDGISYTELWLKELSAPPSREKLRPLESGTILNNGKYRIIHKLGMGGQGTAYIAHASLSHASENEVVLKEFVLPVFPDPRVRKSAAERFQEEANLLSGIDHDQVVGFIEIFIEDHRLYLVMEKVDGISLEDLVVGEGPQSEEVVIDLMISMARILRHLHSLTPPVIHRDFTPDNLILERSGQVKLIDFSVAMEFKNEITGQVVGKVNYIAPEQFQGKASTMSDIYSLGATSFFLLTGEAPEAISTSSPLAFARESSGKFSPSLDAIIRRCTATDLSKRYQSVDNLLVELQALQKKQN